MSYLKKEGKIYKVGQCNHFNLNDNSYCFECGMERFRPVIQNSIIAGDETLSSLFDRRFYQSEIIEDV